MNILEAIGGRKFVFAMYVVLLGFALVAIGKISGEAWTTFAAIVGGTYVAGNVASKAVSQK